MAKSVASGNHDSGISERILMVEFAAVDRFHRGVFFPYLFGALKSRNVPARWLRFGVTARTRYLTGEDGVGLDQEDLQRLIFVALEFRPSRILFSQEPSSQVAAAVKAAAPGAGHEHPGMVPPPEADGIMNLMPAAEDPDPGPDFGFEPANRMAAAMQPLPFIVLGEECTFNAPLASNPVYCDVDLTGAIRNVGCAFCTRPASPKGPRRQFSAQEADVHLRALAKTLLTFSGRLSVRLLGEPAMRNIGVLVERILASGIPPADWLLDSRADTLLRQKAQLAQACKALRGTGHKLFLALIGVENYSQAELLRMNKGITTQGNLDAMWTLLELERDWPDTFDFRTHGGLSMILFTPWTTLEDVAFNLRIAQWCRMEDVIGKLLTSRLRLQPGLPVTLLAERDGLLSGPYTDPALDTAARNLYSQEIPWRFRDPRLETVCRILIRLEGELDRSFDDLANEVATVAEACAERGLSRLDLAVAIVQEAETNSEQQWSPEELLRRVARRWTTTPPTFSTNAQEDWAQPLQDDGLQMKLLWAFSQAGDKPVSKIEPLRSKDVSALEAFHGKEHVWARSRSSKGSEDTWEVFLAARSEDGEEAVALAEQCETEEDAQRWADIAVRLGGLLGYPRCCSSAYAVQDSYVARSSYAGQHLARRIATPGSVSPAMNPWASLLATHYVPCSLCCEESVSKAIRARSAAEAVAPREYLDRLDEQQQHPWLVLLEGQGRALELIPQEEPSESFTFRAGVRTEETSELIRASQADRISLTFDRVLLYRRGELWQDLSARAFLWWHERAFQVDFWSRLLAIRDLSVQRAGTSEALAQRAAWVGESQVAWLDRALRKATSELHEKGVRYAGHWVTELRRAGPTRLRLVLAGGDHDPVVLFVEDARTVEKCLVRRGPFAFSHPSDLPIATTRGRQAVKELADHLTVWLRQQLAR